MVYQVYAGPCEQKNLDRWIQNVQNTLRGLFLLCLTFLRGKYLCTALSLNDVFLSLIRMREEWSNYFRGKVLLWDGNQMVQFGLYWVFKMRMMIAVFMVERLQLTIIFIIDSFAEYFWEAFKTLHLLSLRSKKSHKS